MTEREQPSPPSLVTVEVGGRLYPARTHYSCRVCQHPNRAEIEQEIVNGRSYRAIARWAQESLVEPSTGHPSDHSVKSHVQGEHMPLNAIVQRALVERRSQEIGRSVEEGLENLVDYVSANQVIIQEGYRRLASGEIQPSMGDLLTAIRIQQGIDAELEQSVDVQVWQQALMEYMAITAQVLTEEQKQEFRRKVSQNVVLRSLQKQQTREIENDVA